MPGRGEVLGVGLDRFQRLVLRPALEPRLAEPHGDIGAPRLQLGRLAQRELVALASSSSAFEGSSASKNCSTLAGGIAPANSLDDLAVAERLHRRDALDAVARRQGFVRVDVDLGQQHPPPRLASAASSAGLSALHGPHHSAQKSTTTGILLRARPPRVEARSVTATGRQLASRAVRLAAPHRRRRIERAADALGRSAAPVARLPRLSAACRCGASTRRRRALA